MRFVTHNDPASILAIVKFHEDVNASEPRIDGVGRKHTDR